MVYLITYDLHRPGQNYSELFEAIKGLGEWWHHLESTWLVDTAMDAQAVAERLRARMDQNDNLLVIKVSRPWGGWLPKEAWAWLESHAWIAA